jgi:hypothetical protein
VQSEPLQRNYQNKFHLLRQEIAAILDILQQQLDAAKYLRELIRANHIDANTGKLPYLNKSKEMTVAKQCISMVSMRIESFKEIDRQAALLCDEVKLLYITA